MTELASMAANKITNNLSQQQAQPLHSPVLSSTSASSLVSPDSSATNPISSISSPDVSAPCTSVQTPQHTPLNSTPQTPLAATAPNFISTGVGVLCSTPSSTAGDGDSNSSIQTNATTTQLLIASSGATATTNVISFTNKTAQNSVTPGDEMQNIIVDNVCKSTGSVLEKANIFENLEKQQHQQVKPTSQIPRAEAIYGRREEIYKTTPPSEKDSGKSLTSFFFLLRICQLASTYQQLT